ncbi:MAG: T9SS type A sorting domain-containing protein [Candidatus Cloacimonetes bacterium]|nr:T9SS type A sorting domain-containing protein [Candidatus Cloacimonadota bacterium]
MQKKALVVLCIILLPVLAFAANEMYHGGSYDGYGMGETAEGGSTLPVELSTFTAQFLNGVPTLYWKTESETDNLGWFIYRNAEDDFTTAERITDYLIEGYGTTSEPHHYIYEDANLIAISGDTYWYWIESVDLGGAFHRYEPETVIIQGTPEHHETPEIPKQYGLHQNNPNPLRDGSTEISFRLHNTARVEVKIYNIRGELVKDLYKGIAYEDDEIKDIIWDGRDENGVVQGTGIYLYQLKVNGKPYEVKRLIVIR